MSRHPRPQASSYELERILICTSCEIATFGWVSSKEAHKEDIISTRTFVLAMLDGTEFGKDRQAQLLTKAKSIGFDLFDPSVKEEVRDAIHWAATIKVENSTSEYERKIKAIAQQQNTVMPRDIGFACSILEAYRRHIKEIAAAANSNYLGKLKDKVDVIATVVSMSDGVGNFGPWYMVKYVADSGENLAVFYKEPQDTKVGDHVNLTGTVSKQSEFRGKKETVLNRAKWSVRKVHGRSGE